MNANARPQWCETNLRLDPYAGSQTISFRDGRHDVAVRLEPRGAVVKRRLACGLDVSLALPSSNFEGVAAQAFENEDGTCTVTLSLRHADPALSVPLMVCDDPEEAAADWRSWARTLRLPMLLAGIDGVTQVEDPSRALSRGEPLPRRRRRTTLKHRPNFLRRRRVGVVATQTRLANREMIART